ncbi:hypothetical protein AAHC03_013438 [Spirometra sp. Aus1]
MRVAASILALNTRSPLRWFQARPIETHDSSVPNAYPTSRFGATAIIKGHKLYVFGGATSEMTAFNDMWVYDLTSSYWNRITKRGELPSPRAFAKCGFVGNTLYLYGGCQTCYGLDQGARITWLDDMYSFCTETEIWKHVKLRRASEQMLQPPPVIAGQTGTFVLPSSSEDHFPAALVLFGGYSRLNGVTVNAGFVVLPNLCQWFELPDSMSPTKPAGRFGHATCSLGDCRILVVGGNLRAPQPPHMGLSSTPPSRASASPRTLEMRASVAVDGEPARDVWLLTRTECLPNQAYCNVSWFWTRVDCQYDGPECPPSDFYHAVAVGLPIFELLRNNATQPSDGDADDYKECTSDLLGAPSTLPDSASGNSGGDGDVRDFFPASVVLISTATKRLISLSAGYRVQSRKRCMTSRGTSDSSISPVSPLPPPSPCSSEGVSQPTTSPSRECSINLPLRSFAPAAKPLAAYTLRLSIPKNRNLPSPSDLTRLASPTAVWLGPGKPCLGELSSAPHECLGFSSVYGFGSIFLFGGLSTATSSDPKSGGGDNGVNLLPGDHSVERCSEGANIEAPPWNSEPSRAGQMTHRSVSQPTTSPSRECSINLPLRSFAPAAKPLAAYTLRLSIPKNRNLPSPSDLTRLASPTAVWLGPGKPCLGELSSAPHECLGFSSVYGFGSIFLFGGLSTATSSDPKSGGGDNGVNLLPGDHSVERCSEGANIEAPPWNSEPSRAGQMTHRSETNSCVRKLSGSVRGKSYLETPALYVLHSAEFVSSLAN